MIWLKVNYDPDWVAIQDGRPIDVDWDWTGTIILRPNPSPAAHIELTYRGSLEQRIMAALSALAWLASILGYRISILSSASE